jgi:hypothetical protein
MTNANFTNGEKRANALGIAVWAGNLAEIRTSETGSLPWNTEDTISAPSSADTWENWSDNEALTAGITYLQLMGHGGQLGEAYLECADCTVTLDNTVTPTLTIGSEQGNYSLDAIIYNQTTGQQIRVTYTMGLNDELEVDTDGKTVTDLEDASRQFQALTLVGGPRQDWLPLQPGNNTLEWTQTGTTGLTVTVDFTERYY